jgi:hypothetical protein
LSNCFNGFETGPGAIPRITGKRIGAIKSPATAVLLGEWPAFFGGAWHPLKPQNYPDGKNVLTFVDGHENFSRIYWDGVPDSDPCNYEPPASYGYNWDGE